MKKEELIMVGDFETTVYKGQTYTEVWASGLCPLFSEEALIFNSINETWEYLKSLRQNVKVFYHNLKFDGAFWLSYFIQHTDLEQALEKQSETEYTWVKKTDMWNNSFIYTISDMGQWYSITIKVNNKYITFQDSLKLLPFSVSRIGKAFKTKHQKLDMNYEGFRYAGCHITQQEKEYLKNDLYVVKEALELMLSQGHTKSTIGSCCLAEFKSSFFDRPHYTDYFPDLKDTAFEIDGKSINADTYIRNSYKGGWTYLKSGKENTIYHNGLTADVNSLYPSVMHSESGSIYPIGTPHFFTVENNELPKDLLNLVKLKKAYYFIRIRTRFYLKKDKLPFIQIKNNMYYKSTEMLETSDIYDKKTNKYYRYRMNEAGEPIPNIVTLTLTMTDWELLKDHYDLEDLEILDGCWFSAQIGIFDDYINKYREIKTHAKGAERELAKLYLNNLYGKMATNDNSSFKVAYLKDDNSLGFINVTEHDKKLGYIPIGSAITSYARNFTIRTAQDNYKYFIYADTDSIHCNCTPDKLKNVPVHDTAFCHWKLESFWDKAIFVRQKTYIEHITHENQEQIEMPYYNVKCAGMPQKCKNLFLKSMEGVSKKDLDSNIYSQEEKDFLKTKRSLKDFKIGLKIYGKLLPKRIEGGIVLQETTYEMR